MMRDKHLQQQLAAIERQLLRVPLISHDAPGGQSYVAIDDVRGKQDISTLSGTEIDGILYDGGSAPSAVPTADPDDTDEADLTTDNIGWGTLRSSGERVWVVLRGDPGSGAVEDMARSVPAHASILSVDTINLDATDTGGRVKVYLPREVR